MNQITFSLEKGFRLFDKEVNFFHFFMVQFEIPKEKIKTQDYTFKIKNTNIGEYFRELFIDTEKNRIITYNSHEDPLVYDETNFYLCLQIEINLLKKLIGESEIFLFDSSKKIIAKTTVLNLYEKYLKYDGTHYSSIKENNIYTTKDCYLTLHLGNQNGAYSEERFTFKSHEYFNFSDYIKNYEYIGLQCSYEDESPEIEEKHIIVGQKGIFLSGYFYSENGQKINPPLLFMEKYQKEYSTKDFIKINSIDELLSFYENKKPRFFESSLGFLIEGYSKNITYNQDHLFCEKKSKNINQFSLELCQSCPKNFKCAQVVPSGLGFELFKHNLTNEDVNSCKVFKIL